MGPNSLDNTQGNGQPMMPGPQPVGPGPVGAQPQPMPEQPLGQPVPLSQPISLDQPMQPVQPVTPQPTPVPDQLQQMGQPQPVEQPQPMSVEQPQPVEQPQMTGQPMPMGQPQPMEQPVPMGQPAAQPMDPNQPQKPKTNFLLIGIIAGVAVLLTVVGIVIALNVGGKSPEPAEPIPEPETEAQIVPTPELAASVCEKYNGTLVVSEGEEVADDYKEVESRYVCQRYKNAQQEGDMQTVTSYTADDFMYQVDFVEEDKIDERWTRMKSAITKSGNEILENSDDVIIAHNSMSGAGGVNVETDMVIYKEATVALSTYTKDNPLAEEILKELGFVEDENNGGEEGGEGGENGGGSGVSNADPSPELAKSVCKKHGGEAEHNESRAMLDSNETFKGIFSSMDTCKKDDDFAYEIYFADNDKLEDFWSKAKASMEEDGSEDSSFLGEYTILENSDDYIKFYITMIAEDSSAFMYSAAYKNAMVILTTTSNITAEEILAELGFPDQKQAD